MTLWPMARISVGDDSMITFEEHAGLALIRKHKAFTLNVPDATWVDQFDRIDMTASTKARPDAPMQPPPRPLQGPGVNIRAFLSSLRLSGDQPRRVVCP